MIAAVLACTPARWSCRVLTDDRSDGPNQVRQYDRQRMDFFHCRWLTLGKESGSIRSSPTSQVMHRPTAATLKNLPPCRFVEKDEWLARRICRVWDSANPNRISPSFNYLSN